MSLLIRWLHPERNNIPRFAVIFSLERSNDLQGYEAMDRATLEKVATLPGYLGYESVYAGNRGIFISYWESKEAIEAWRTDPLHKQAKSHGSQWYAAYVSAITEIHAWHAMPENQTFP